MVDKTRTRVDVDGEAQRLAKAAAALKGVSIKDVVTDAVKQYCRRVIKVYVQDESGEA